MNAELKSSSFCARDLLLYLEEELEYTISEFPQTMKSLQCKPIQIEKIVSDPFLSKHTYEEISYNLTQLYKDGYITFQEDANQRGAICVTDITPAGHTFLKLVKNSHVWHDVTYVLSKVGELPIPTISKIAESVIFTRILPST